MSKNKVNISFSIPAKVKEMLEALANKSYSTNTKCVVDMIRREHSYWFDNKKEEKDNG
jgi:hypothetical protein